MSTLAEYNNNPGNLRPPQGVKYEGQIGVDDNGFAVFENKDYGRRALINDIEIKLKRGLNSPDKFIERYAPRGNENPQEAQDNYKVWLAGSLGLESTNQPFPKDSAEKIADAIAQFEGGTWGKPPAASSGPSAEEAENQTSDQQRRDRLVEEVKELPGKVAQEYPTATRAAIDIAGASLGAQAGRESEGARQRAARAAAQLNREQAAAARASAQAASPGAAQAAPAPEGGTPGEKWARKVVGQEFVKPGVQSVTEASSDYRRAVPQGKIAQRLPKMFNMPHLPSEGQPMSIADRLIAQQQAAQAAANQPQPRPSPLSRITGGMSRGMQIAPRAFPGLTGMLGGLGAAELGQEIFRRGSEGDVPGSILASIGALGSAASLLPFPQTRVGGPIMALTSPLALYLYDKAKDRAVSQAQGYGALASGAQLPAPSIYSGRTSP